MKAISQEQKQAMDQASLTERFLNHPLPRSQGHCNLPFFSAWVSNTGTDRPGAEGWQKVLIPKTYPKVAWEVRGLQSTAVKNFLYWSLKGTWSGGYLGLIRFMFRLGFTTEAIDRIWCGGYYDRYLSILPGASLSTPILVKFREFNFEDYDIPVQEVLTYEGNSW